MGRVARYKKVKSVDPFAKRKAGEVNPLYEPKRGKRRRHGAKPIEFDLVPKKEDNFKGTFTSSDDVAKGKKRKSSQSKHNVELSKKLGFQVFDLKVRFFYIFIVIELICTLLSYTYILNSF